eukprot:Nk52_evm6s578 gene=Nk52_evmTU6s578
MSGTGSIEKLRIIHFNDVYNIEEKKTEPVGGAARFTSALNQLKNKQKEAEGGDYLRPLVLFSGDLFNPSLMSVSTKGEHLVPFVNRFGIDVACFGNHDFDFGVEHLEKLEGKCNFPWLMSNVFLLKELEGGGEKEVLISGAKEYYVMQHGPWKIGFIGIVEKEWLDTLPNFPENYVYRDFIGHARHLCGVLRREHGVDMIIALTHMRLHNDKRLAAEVPEICVVLGGHDHFYEVCEVEVDAAAGAECSSSSSSCKSCYVVKSGTDFMNLTEMEMGFVRKKKKKEEELLDLVSFEYQQIDVTSTAYEPDPEVEAMVEKATAEFAKSLNIVACETVTEWDARSSISRTQETALGNFLCDILRMYYGTDVALLAGGTIRSDAVYGPGAITVGDILNILPFQDPAVVLALTGKDLREAIENGVSTYPAQEGRFPHVSGVKFSFDPKRPPMQRVVDLYSVDSGKPIEDDKVYQVATRLFMAEGKDGYSSLENGKFLVDEENGFLMCTMVRYHLSQINVVNAFSSKHKLLCKFAKKWRESTAERRGSGGSDDGSKSALLLNKYFIEIAPVVEGRITIL